MKHTSIAQEGVHDRDMKCMVTHRLEMTRSGGKLEKKTRKHFKINVSTEATNCKN